MHEPVVYVDLFDPEAGPDKPANAMHAAVYASLRKTLRALGRHEFDSAPEEAAALPTWSHRERRIDLAALYGLLLADGRDRPEHIDETAVKAAIAELEAGREHFAAVHEELPLAMAVASGPPVPKRIETRELAQIARRLVALHVDLAAIERRIPETLEEISRELKSMTTTTTTTKEVYPDIYAPVRPDATNKETAERDKARKERLYLAVRKLLLERFLYPPTPPLPEKAESFPGSGSTELNDAQKAYFVAVHGLLLADGQDDPELRTVRRLDDATSAGTAADPFIAPLFVSAVVDAVQEFQAHKDLFERVFRELRSEGCKRPEGGIAPPCSESTIHTRHVALVTRRLVELDIPAGDPHVRRHIIEALSLALRGRVDGSASGVVIDLPDLDLDEGIQGDIHRDNVLALSAIYYTAMLEEMKLFSVADRVVEQFHSGMVPISRGTGGDRMYGYYRDSVNRFTESERRSLYARTFGLAQGSVDEPLPNREFSDLWIRFLSAVSLNKRQAKEELQRVHPQQVFKSARDLAVNLSLHGYGIAHFAAVELQQLVRDVVAMLSHADVLNAYGVFHIWQLVDRVSQMYLGGSVNGVQHRTMAHSGANIIKWLGEHALMLSSPFTDKAEKLFEQDVVLVGYVERWLAVTGTNDQTVERFSEPVVAPSQLTIPSLQMPDLRGMPDAVRGAFNRMSDLVPAAVPQN